MTKSQYNSGEMCRLLWAMREDELAPEDAKRLRAMLLDDPLARERYVLYMFLSGSLEWDGSARAKDRAVVERSSAKCRDSVLGGRGLENAVGTEVELPLQHDLEPSVLSFPSLSTTHYPLPTNFVGGPVFSYMVATLILGVMLLSAWVYKITHFQAQIVETPSKSVPTDIRPELVFVGRISGMKDCRWADSQTEAYAGASVPLGRKYALSAGLMQITYDSGAKVILQGPCTYTVESRAGGYLLLGKLTAKVESAKPQAANQKSSPLSPLPSLLFFVRTPTAIVTDLGTEFGVEVDKEGNTASHVFRGSVKVHVVGGDSEQKDVVLRENESARVEKNAGGDLRLVLPSEVGNPPKFVRRMVEPPKLLDLLDIVAGGRGTSNRRECGIDPATGKQDTWLLSTARKDDHGYHRVAWHPLIDGVFIPHISTRLPPTPQAVQLDSAGNTFDQFLEPRIVDGEKYHCTIQGYTVGSIWSRAADLSLANRVGRADWIYSLIDDEDEYMPKDRGLLRLHANVGITFDLAAMRKMYEGVRPARFRATAGLCDGPRKYLDAFGIADLWIFVDGRLKWVRKDIRHQDGAIKVDVSLGPKDRFLTIVSTNGQHGRAYDWIVLGDPTLETTPVDAN